MLGWFRRRWKHEVNVAHLENFNDRMLADIGLRRHEIAHRVYGYEERWKFDSLGRAAGAPVQASADKAIRGINSGHRPKLLRG